MLSEVRPSRTQSKILHPQRSEPSVHLLDESTHPVSPKMFYADHSSKLIECQLRASS
jgi:hypothetical protein